MFKSKYVMYDNEYTPPTNQMDPNGIIKLRKQKMG